MTGRLAAAGLLLLACGIGLDPSLQQGWLLPDRPVVRPRRGTYRVTPSGEPDRVAVPRVRRGRRRVGAVGVDRPSILRVDPLERGRSASGGDPRWRGAAGIGGFRLSTTKTHLASLMSKLGARNRVELAMWAYETARVNR